MNENSALSTQHSALASPLFTLLYPSHRAERVELVCDLWRARASDAGRIELVMVANADDGETLRAMTRVKWNNEEIGWKKIISQPSEPSDYVKAANAGSPHCNGKIIVLISDDFVPLNCWDEALLSVLPRPDGEWVVLVGDGNRTGLCTLPVVTKKRLERFGGLLYWPDYKSMFCDTELSARARLDNVLIDARHLVFEHLHPVYRGRKKDKKDEEHGSDERLKAGEALFLKRLVNGFRWPCDSALSTQHSALPPQPEYVACIQATQDDFCLTEVCERLFEEGVRNFAFCCPKVYWDREPVPAECVAQVHAVSEWLLQKGAWFVRFWHDDLIPFWLPEMNRSRWETNYRNFCVERLHKIGYQHVLIVDGDELWRPGLLRKIGHCVKVIGPPSICCEMFPMVGSPAVYAVQGATDNLLVYIRADERFRDIRSPNRPSFFLNVNGAYHFTAVRRTREELIAKMRKSGHYDDPEYTFEKWIAETLPNLKPGLRNVHMWRDGSTWPELRVLTESELEEIPDRLKASIAKK